MAEPERCSSIASAHDEPLHATASQVRSWLLVEQPGPWGYDAVGQSRLPSAVATELKARAKEHDVRILLIRRPFEEPAEGPHHCFLAHSGRRRRFVEQAVVGDVSMLLDVDLSPLGQGRPVGFGRPRLEPLYLVCTNGRHDPCCAQFGRPVARALAARSHLDGSVWECSHLGGDRFAGNLVCLPHGLYFGRLRPPAAMGVVDSYERGLVELDHYRGRAGDPYVVQAAELFVRRHQGLRRVDELVPTGWRRREPSLVEVDFAGPSGRSYRVSVEVRRAEEGRLLTCVATRLEHPPTYTLRDVRQG